MNVNQLAGERKEFFVVSQSGKPIYSFNGNATDFVELCGVIQAIISHFLEDKDPIQYLKVI
jgi:hypothetical protein